jgi:hypothetical protein
VEKPIQGSGSAGDIQVKLYADLSAAAFKNKLEDELALWQALRSIPTVKGGDITCDSLNDLVGQLQVFGYGQRTAFRQLFEANGRFFRVCQIKGHTVVKIYGLLTVCRSLGIGRLTMDRHDRKVNAGSFNSLRKRRSQLYASIFRPEGVRAGPMTRETITTLTGLSKTQQRRYDVIAGIKRTPNYEVREIKRLPTDLDTVMVPVTMQVAGKSRIYTVPRRLGNIYHTSQVSGKKGQTGKVQKALRPHKASWLAEGTLLVRKAFFSSLKKLTHYYNGLKGHDRAGFYLVRNYLRVIEGRLEWCHYQEDPGPLFKGVEV